MKATLMFVAALVLLCGGCVSQQGEQLTETQKDQIKSDVKGIADTIWARFQRLDGASTVQYMWDSPEFVAYNADGSHTDYQGIKSILTTMRDSVSSFGLTTTREEFPLVTKDIAVYVWSGTSAVTYKTGITYTFNPDAETFMFRKIDNQWKVVFVHESATIVAQKVAKKK